MLAHYLPRRAGATRCRWSVPVLVGLAVGPIIPLGLGCGDAPRPADASPVVTLESEPGRKALAESAALVRLRQKQEASRKRAFIAPEG